MYVNSSFANLKAGRQVQHLQSISSLIKPDKKLLRKRQLLIAQG